MNVIKVIKYKGVQYPVSINYGYDGVITMRSYSNSMEPIMVEELSCLDKIYLTIDGRVKTSTIKELMFSSIDWVKGHQFESKKQMLDREYVYELTNG
jgi:hypothetical protein